MNQKNRMLERYGLWLVDLASISISFFLATYIRFGNYKDMGNKEIHFQVCLLFLFLCTVYSFFVDWNRNAFKRNKWKEIPIVIQYSVMLLLIAEVIMVFAKWADVFSRLVTVYFFGINTMMTLFFHYLFKKIVRIKLSSDKSAIKVMVVTQPDLIAQTLERLRSELDMCYQIVAVGCMGKEDVLLDKEISVIWNDEIVKAATTMALDEVFFDIPDVPRAQVEKLLYNFSEMGIDCHYNLEHYGLRGEKGKMETFADYMVITYTRMQNNYKKMLVKRCIDIVGGTVGLVITGLFYPFVALAIKLDSPGPILFSQIRIGRNGRRFKIYKFRSMYVDAEERKKELEQRNEMRGLMFKIENDPRITKVGKFIRKYSIDELPQFYNVLKGDMSLVGTRPPTEDEFIRYNQFYRRRISMTPGLTGMWQVSGRSEIENFDDVVRYDLEYIDSWSLLLDIKIILQTVSVVFTGRGSK